MTEPDRNVLEQLVEGSAEPVFVARIDHPDWPVVLANSAFGTISDYLPVTDKPLADVVESLVGRDLALEISETIRGGQETTIAVEFSGREYLLVLKPLSSGGGDAQYYAAYWRGTAGGTLAVDTEIQQALLKAKRRIRDLTRDDPVTGLLNEATFTEVLTHDWAVASRENSSLALVAFRLDDYPAYLEVFGKHASDSCLRRVAQAIRRCLRRASDVAARLDTEDGHCIVVLSHDWAVASRENSSLALVAFRLDDYPAYLEVFGKHASDSCLRRVAQAIRRCLRRASDVAARLDTEDGHCLVVLSHSSNESGVNDFAARISAAVRELGLHHPRSRQAKFVTVSYRTKVMAAGEDDETAEGFLSQVLG